MGVARSGSRRLSCRGATSLSNSAAAWSNNPGWLSLAPNLKLVKLNFHLWSKAVDRLRARLMGLTWLERNALTSAKGPEVVGVAHSTAQRSRP
jgi:hypothetical protein